MIRSTPENNADTMTLISLAATAMPSSTMPEATMRMVSITGMLADCSMLGTLRCARVSVMEREWMKGHVAAVAAQGLCRDGAGGFQQLRCDGAGGVRCDEASGRG